MDCLGSKTHEYSVALKGSSAESEEEPQEWTGLEGKVALGRKAPEAIWIGMKGKKGTGRKRMNCNQRRDIKERKRTRRVDNGTRKDENDPYKNLRYVYDQSKTMRMKTVDESERV